VTLTMVAISISVSTTSFTTSSLTWFTTNNYSILLTLGTL